MLVDDYIKYYETYKEKFGDRAVVLMQVGSFFELYSKKDERNNIGYLHKICRNLDIQLTRKDKFIFLEKATYQSSDKRCFIGLLIFAL